MEIVDLRNYTATDNSFIERLDRLRPYAPNPRVSDSPITNIADASLRLAIEPDLDLFLHFILYQSGAGAGAGRGRLKSRVNADADSILFM